MRILHVVPSYIPAYRYGGPIKSVHGLCKGLAGLGHDVHIFTTNVDGPGDSDVPLGVPVDIDGVKVWYFPSTRLRRLYWSSQMANALAEQIGSFDLLHLHSIYLWPTWAAARAARRAGIPYLLSPRGMLVKELVKRKSRWFKTAWLTFIERCNLEKSAGIHVTSRLEAEEAMQFGYRFPALVTIPNGIDLHEDHGTDMISPAIQQLLTGIDSYILYIGRINWKKGLDRLIPAMSHVSQVHLVMAGNDEENYQPVLEALADKHGVRDRITFTGLVQGTDKTALLQNATVLVLPSYSENFGNVVLEAMAASCPVAVTPEVGAAEIVRKYGVGLVMDRDPATLGNGLRDMLENNEELTRMGQRGPKAVEDNFTWDAVAKQMAAVYAEIVIDINSAKNV
jgi:glycosyltransferase involved in cell wall biosynthesis